MLTLLFAIAFFCLCIQAGIKDTISFTIPNWMNGTFIIMFVPAAFAASIGWETAGWHILAGLVALVVSFGLFSFRIFGGGDAKMIPGVILWIGPGGVLHFLVGMAVVGGLLAILVIMARKMVPVEIAPGFAQKILNHDNGIPYGVAIAAGGFLAASQSPLLSDFVQQLSGFH